jgi:uncharacterized membrane protein YfcA
MGAEYWLFVLLGLAATLVSAVFGFGTALIALSLGALILPVKEVIALSAVLFAASTLTKSVLFRSAIPWPMAIGLSLVSLPFAWLGGLLVDALPADLLRRLLGLMVLVSLGISWLRGKPLASPGAGLLIAGSGAYGFVSGLLGSGNLIKAILFRRMALRQEGFVGIMAATSVLANGGKLLAYAQVGLLPAEQWPLMAVLVLVAVLAVFLGRMFLRRMESRWFEAGLQVIMAISAVLLLF